MSEEITRPDGVEADLIEHLSRVHQKGTRGFTREYLASLHRNLHQRKHEPQPEHTHEDHEDHEDAAGDAQQRAEV